jgi:hypothetical protein
VSDSEIPRVVGKFSKHQSAPRSSVLSVTSMDAFSSRTSRLAVIVNEILWLPNAPF